MTPADLERIARLSKRIEITAARRGASSFITVRIAVLVGGLNVWATGEGNNIHNAWDLAVVEMERLR